MGLVNRVVPRGTARQEAEQLARELSAFPQTCMRADRLSAYEQHGLPLDQALQNELRHGSQAHQEALAGASRFQSGVGRHGRFDGG